MSEKKGFLGSLFGSKKGSGGCCNMEIVEEPEGGSCCCGSSCTPETTAQAEKAVAEDARS